MTRPDLLRVSLVGVLSFTATSILLRSRDPVSTGVFMLGDVAVALGCYAQIDSPRLRHAFYLCSSSCDRCRKTRALRFERRRQAAMERGGSIALERAIEDSRARRGLQ